MAILVLYIVRFFRFPRETRIEEFAKRFSPLMEGTKSASEGQEEEEAKRCYLIFVPILFFTKRLVFVSFLIVANEYLWVQVATLNFLALASIIYVLWFRPMESRQANLIEVFNDYTLLLLTYLLWCFTDIIGEPETRY